MSSTAQADRMTESESGLMLPPDFKAPVARPLRSSWLAGEPGNPDAFRQVTGLFNSYVGLGYMLPWEVLDYVELLATYNPDYSQAVENIKMLANSGHTLIVRSGSKLATRRLKTRLEEKARTIQARSGGIDGVIDKLMDQAATYGAMCFSADTEIITNQGIRQIGDLAGTSVKVMTKSGRWVEAPIRSFGRQRLTKIEMHRGKQKKTVFATAEHRWLVQSSKGADGAYAVRPVKGVSRSLSMWQVDRQTDELSAGDRLVTVEPRQQTGNLAKIPVAPFGVAQGIVFGDGTAPASARGVLPSASLDLYGDNVADLLKFFPLSETTSCKLGGVRVLGLPRFWKELPSIHESSAHLMGWLAGYFAADGCVTESGTAIISSCDRKNLELVRDIIVKLGGVAYQIKRKNQKGGGEVAERGYEHYTLSFPSGSMPEHFYVRPHHLIRRAEMNLRSWVIDSVMQTDRVEEVFCATVPEFSCFALEGNILTGNCGEWVLNEDMTDVLDFVDLNPKKIRFVWEEDEQAFMPYQKVTGAQAKASAEAGQKVINDLVKLNPLTFHYFDFDAAPESPYGTPPFLAALANIAIQRDMVANMAQIVKKIGLLGIIDLKIDKPLKQPDETNDQYINRARGMLEAYAPIAEGMVKEGGLVHFDDVTATTTQLGGNAAGATNIMKVNEELVFSGLKSMPSVQGRSYSTTETYAGVAYEIILRNTSKYQRAAKRMIESGYWLMAYVWGESPDKIQLIFNENRSLNRLQEAAAKRAEIENAILMWIMGLFDQDDVGQALSVAEPKKEMKEPPENIMSVVGAKTDAEATKGSESSGQTASTDPAEPSEPIKEFVHETVAAAVDQIPIPAR